MILLSIPFCSEPNIHFKSWGFLPHYLIFSSHSPREPNDTMIFYLDPQRYAMGEKQITCTIAPNHLRYTFHKINLRRHAGSLWSVTPRVSTGCGSMETLRWWNWRQRDLKNSQFSFNVLSTFWPWTEKPITIKAGKCKSANPNSRNWRPQKTLIKTKSCKKRSFSLLLFDC